MEPVEVIRACRGEIDRYRTAIEDQLPRIQAADTALRVERRRAKRDKLLDPHPGMSLEDYLDARERFIRKRDNQCTGRVKTDAQFLLVAV